MLSFVLPVVVQSDKPLTLGDKTPIEWNAALAGATPAACVSVDATDPLYILYTSGPDVAECAVVGVADELKGQIPLGLLVLKAEVEREHAEICDETVQLVRERVGPVAVFNRRSSGLRSDA